MVDALVSGASAERRVGSSPILGTSKGVFFEKAPFSFARIGLVQLVAPRVTNLRMAVVCCANNCLCQMIVFENKFSAIICQTQQSSIATATLRSPLGFCRRSSPVLGKRELEVVRGC